MILYIVQVSVERAIESDWLQWMRTHHIPRVVGTGCFQSHVLYRVAEPADAAGRATYAIHYSAASRAEMDRYVAKFAPALRQEVIDRYGDRFAASRMILEPT